MMTALITCGQDAGHGATDACALPAVGSVLLMNAHDGAVRLVDGSI
jgi:hypothetical protein